MKTISLVTFLSVLLLNAGSAQETVISAFRIKWENSKPYLLKMARKMPAKHYHFKPVNRQMSFKKKLLHIRDTMLRLVTIKSQARTRTKTQ